MAGQSIPLKSYQQLGGKPLGPDSSERIAVALEGLSFSKHKQLLVEWIEKGEGRKVMLKIPHVTLRRARKLPL